MAQARSARAINRRGKTSIRDLQYRPRDEVSKIFIIPLPGSGTISINEERLQISAASPKQNESI